MEDTDQILQRELLGWYRAHRRDLPWRRTSDPYAIWVSEIMLQQTQVRTVIPYYERFLARFPSVDSLAEADLEEVLHHWAGLGYYSRARNLHAAARRVAEKHGGVFPESREEILALPGIGRYTVGAILSIAFNQPEPILDGNVIRVLSRIRLVSGDVETSAIKARLWEMAESLIPAGAAGDFNQALMELGAIICTPYDPDCVRCPVGAVCGARESGAQAQLPESRKGRATERVKEVSALFERDGGWLIGRRPAQGLWGGLWEFPRGRCLSDEEPETALVRVARESLGVEIEVGELIAKIKHSVMHYAITLHAFKAQIVSGEPEALGYEELRWASPEEMSALPFSSPQGKISRELTVVSRQ